MDKFNDYIKFLQESLDDYRERLSRNIESKNFYDAAIDTESVAMLTWIIDDMKKFAETNNHL